MISLDDVWQRVWPWLLALTVALSLVLALRLPLRRRLGVQAAFLLWWLWPMAIVVALLPHSRTLDVPAVAASVAAWRLPASPTSIPAHSAFDAAQPGLPWATLALLLWGAGVLVVTATTIERQRAYRRRLQDATPRMEPMLAARVVQANDHRTGPALVGVMRPRIVVPSDFDTRYDAKERALILAHEILHARRGDAWWCLFAQAMTALCWFHPLVWWATAALRHDIELACDAAVMREHAGAQRCYAGAMLKTQLTSDVLPIGCAWSPRHPVVDRVAWLRMPTPRQPRRIRAALLAFCGLLAIAIYAVGQPAPYTGDARTIALASHYRLELVTHKNGHADIDTAVCLARGERYDMVSPATADAPAWRGTIRLEPYAQDPAQIVALTALDGGGFRKFHPELHAGPGERTTFLTQSTTPAMAGSPATQLSFAMALTMRVGC